MSDDGIRLAWGQTTDDTGQKRIGVWIQRDDEPAPEGLSLELMEERECSLKEGFLRLARVLKGLRPEDIVAHVDRETFLLALERLEAELEAEGQEREREQKRDKPARRQRIPVRDAMQIGSGFGEQAIHRICFHSHLLQTGPDNPYPRATFRLGRQEVAVELSPPEAEGTLLLPEQEALLAAKMGQMAQRLGGMDAALFCILQDLWIQKASHPDERVLCNVDYLLEARGIKPRRNSDDRSGGYRPEQRAETIAALNRLRHLAFDVDYLVRQKKGKKSSLVSVRRHGRAIEVSDTIGLGQGQLDLEPGRPQYELRAFLFAPGPTLAATLMGNQEVGRQVAHLNRRALCYDLKKQSLELALALYLATLWRCGASRDGVGVRRLKPETIMEAVGLEVDQRQPSRTLQSLEKALDTLQNDGLIAGWEWDCERWDAAAFHSEKRHAPGWVNAWKSAACVLIEPPAEVAQAYEDLALPSARPAPALPATTQSNLGTRLRERRIALGMTGLQAAEQMGLNRTLLGHIEAGRRRPSKNAAARIRAWLERDM